MNFYRKSVIKIHFILLNSLQLRFIYNNNLMKKIIVLFAIVFITTFTLSAQIKVREKVKDNFTKIELQTFLKVYKYTLDHPFDPLVSMKKNSSRIRLSEQRLTEIMQSQFAGNELKLSEGENYEMSKLQKLVEKDKELYDKQIERYIKNQNMKPARYKEIEALYQENTKFQSKVNALHKE